MQNKTISIIIPVYNEEQVIEELIKHLFSITQSTSYVFEFIFINDGSIDKTLKILLSIKDTRIKIIDFSRNFGHQIAISAGIDYAIGDALIIIDADLQDPPETILEMIKKWEKGYDVVYGVRKKREGENWFKLITAKLFYRFNKRISNIEIPVDVGDFRLLSRPVVDEVKKMREKNRFIRGMISWVGFRQCAVYYERQSRFAGGSKYPFRKMFTFAFDGIFSFSVIPLQLVTFLGFLVSIFSFGLGVYFFYLKLFTQKAIHGWSSTVIPIVFLGGVQLLSIGVLGQYIGRIYDEVRNRPLYIVKKFYSNYDK